ncbi:RING-H2 finger protein ATL68-like [Ananas comosus]|uniref:RING-H2 finger protein ATL68 n=1 Tax=Ananas comosus TaxID=4615 RepID=A0A199UE93_ANACO|nr:RING-H2 finger protein ATL68-like [Ananas comosus]OAY62885.1 RING-H2 finger protein ATL68 [Ananas comosus]
MSSSSSFLSTISNLGLGYAIAISLGFLVLLSSLLLASYLCRRRRRLPTNPNPNSNASAAASGVAVPRIIFVAEDDDDDDDRRGGGGSAAAGLDPAAIGSYPKFPYSAAKGLGGDPTCSICLCEYREGEMLRMMPDCRHYFHLPCIDAWLGLNASCPVCRTSPMPTPLSTPLSELVPLSQYAADRRRR